MMITLAHRPGVGRSVVIQATVLLGVFVVLAVTPAPVEFPDGPWEVVILVKGAAALLLTNLLIAGAGKETRGDARSAVKPPAAALTEMRRLSDYHVEDAGEGVVGVVNEPIGDRLGTPLGLIVSSGWFGSRRFLVPLPEVRWIDNRRRSITIGALPESEEPPLPNGSK